MGGGTLRLLPCVPLQPGGPVGGTGRASWIFQQLGLASSIKAEAGIKEGAYYP
jgi:hypothetical protein